MTTNKLKNISVRCRSVRNSEKFIHDLCVSNDIIVCSQRNMDNPNRDWLFVPFSSRLQQLGYLFFVACAFLASIVWEVLLIVEGTCVERVPPQKWSVCLHGWFQVHSPYKYTCCEASFYWQTFNRSSLLIDASSNHILPINFALNLTRPSMLLQYQGYRIMTSNLYNGLCYL